MTGLEKINPCDGIHHLVDQITVSHGQLLIAALSKRSSHNAVKSNGFPSFVETVVQTGISASKFSDDLNITGIANVAQTGDH